MAKKRIKPNKLTSVRMLRKTLQARKEELFNLALKYSDLLGARDASKTFIEDAYDADQNIWYAFGEEWCKSLQEYKMDRPIHRAIVIMAFFATGTTYLIEKVAGQWNGMDPFYDEVNDDEEKPKDAEASQTL